MTLDVSLRRRISEALDSEGGLDADTELNRILASNPDAQAYAGELLMLESQLRDWPLPERSDADWEAFASSIESRLDEPLSAIDDPTLPPEAHFDAAPSADITLGAVPAMAVASAPRAQASVIDLASRRTSPKNKWFGYSAVAASVLVASIAGISVFRGGSSLNAPSERDAVVAEQTASQAPQSAAPALEMPTYQAAPPSAAEPAPVAPAAEAARPARGAVLGADRANSAGPMAFGGGFDEESRDRAVAREQSALGRGASVTESELRQAPAPVAAAPQAMPAAPATTAPLDRAAVGTLSAPRARASGAAARVDDDFLAEASGTSAGGAPPSAPSAAPARTVTRSETAAVFDDADTAALPRTLSSSAARAVFVRIQPQVVACARPSGVDAVGVSVDVVGATGAVAAARVSGGIAGSPAGACVERVLRATVFPRFASDRATVTNTFVVATPEVMRHSMDAMDTSF